MTELIKLDERKESGSRAMKILRGAGVVPGVIYGEQLKNRHVSFSSVAQKQLDKLESGTLFDIQIEGESEPSKVILHDIQRDPVTGRIDHIDLYQVRMDRELHLDIPVVFEGVASAVKDLGGTLVRVVDHFPIVCLPGDLIHKVTADISALKTFSDVIRVKDLSLPETVRTPLKPEDIVANVTPPRTEEELASLNTETAVNLETIEVAGKDKKDDESADADAAPDDKKDDKKKDA